MKQFFEKITLTFISYGLKNETTNKSEIIELCLYFLIRTKSWQYLFTTIYQAIKAFGLLEIFLEKIDNHIIQG